MGSSPDRKVPAVAAPLLTGLPLGRQNCCLFCSMYPENDEIAMDSPDQQDGWCGYRQTSTNKLNGIP